MDKTEKELSNSDEQVSGEIFIGAGETDGLRLIAKAAKDLQEQYPQITYRNISGDAVDITERLDKELIDFALLPEPVDIPKYSYLKFPVKDVWGALMRRDCSLARKKCISPKDLQDLPLIVSRYCGDIFDYNTSTRQGICGIFFKFHKTTFPAMCELQTDEENVIHSVFMVLFICVISLRQNFRQCVTSHLKSLDFSSILCYNVYKDFLCGVSVLPRINGKKRCANCFCEIKSETCLNCGYSKNTASSDAEALPRGTKLAEKYIVGGVIGRGGFGKTYFALDIKSDKTLAIKEYFPPNIAVRERKTLTVKPISEKKSSVYNNGLEHFSEEAERVSRFNGNPNIVNVFECFRENGTAYCVMEFLSGITLEKYVENHGAASVEQCVYLAEKLASALVAIHSAGLIHRDIAPDNIMLCSDGKVKLLDFGAARKPSEETSLTVMMKTGFTPVEQYSDGAELTPKTDIYALGMTLFYALTGKKPKSVFARMENGRDFSESLWAVTENFRNIVEKAAAINSAERFESAAEFLNALSDTKIRGEGFSLSSEEFSPQNSLKVTKEIRPAKKRYFLGGLCAGILLCGAALTPVIILNKPRIESPRTQQEQSSTTSSQTGQEESSVTPALPYTMEFGDFEGNFSSQYVGKISQNTLKSFGSDVKITLDIETVADFVNFPEVYLIYPVDSSSANLISYCAAFGEQRTADVSGAVAIEQDARQFSFVLTSKGIGKLGGGFGFETYHVAIKSITLEAADGEYSGFELQNGELPENSTANYSVSTGNGGRATVSAELDEQYYVTDWGGNMTNYLPISAFDCFDGDIKLTFQIEYSPKLPKEDNQYQMLYMQTLGSLDNHFFEFAETVQTYDENGSPLISRAYNLGIFPAFDCTECSVILPKNIVGKICGGLNFTGDNMIIKSVVIENA